jgi:hypothetical protein
MLLDRQGPFPEMVVATTVTVRIGGPDGESQSGARRKKQRFHSISPVVWASD